MSTPIPQPTAGPSPLVARPQQHADLAQPPIARPTPAPPAAPDRVTNSDGLTVALGVAGVVALAIPVAGELELGGLAAAAGARALANAPALTRAAAAIGDWVGTGGAERAAHNATKIYHAMQSALQPHH